MGPTKIKNKVALIELFEIIIGYKCDGLQSSQLDNEFFFVFI